MPGVNLPVVLDEAAILQALSPENLQKNIEASKFGSLYSDEIFSTLVNTCGSKAIRTHQGNLNTSLKSMKYLGNNLYTTQAIFDTTSKIATSISKLQQDPSEILQKMGELWSTKLDPNGFSALSQEDLLLFAGKPGFKKGDTKINAPDEKQLVILNEWFAALKQPANKSLHLIEGVPGSGKTAGILVQFIHTFYEYSKTSTVKPRMFFSAPNAAGMNALQGDLGYREGTLGVAKSILTIDELKKVTFEKNDIIIIDEIYTISLKDFQAIADAAATKGAVLILSGDSLQNLPNQPSIMGMMPYDYMFTASRRACRTEIAGFPAQYVQDLKNNPGGNIPNALATFKNNNLINLLREIDILHEIWLEFDKDRDGTLIIASPKKVDILNDYIAQQTSGSISLSKINYTAVYADQSMAKRGRLSREGGAQKTRPLALFNGAKIRFKANFVSSGSMSFTKNSDYTIQVTANKELMLVDKDLKVTPLPDQAPIDFNYALTSVDSQGASVRRALVY